ncbi:hypothetical protein AB1Y20_011410 [Prymnesium parvum]|uniref:Uncharacterized protein n=1 Tax=Prymnesium parvum TaxID=97485 RepID=A0AB34IPA3_PRYPA
MDDIVRAAPAAVANSSRALEPALSAELSSIVDRLQAAGRCSDVALASLGVVRLFEAWVAADASAEGSDSLAQVQQAVEHDANPLHLVGYSGNWGLWRHDLVSRQRADTEAVARAAIQSSRLLLDTPKESPCEQTSPYTWPGASSSLGSASIGTDGFMRSEFGSGRVVYGSGYNSILKGFPKWTYADLDGEQLAKQELWSTLRNNLGVNLLSCRLFPSKVRNFANTIPE